MITRPTFAAPLGVKTITEPTEEPVTIDECRAHLEFPYYDDSDVDPVDDEAIMGKLADAREYCEDFTGLYIARRVVEIALDSYPTGAIVLPFAPVVEIVSFEAAGEAVDADLYTLDDYSKPPRLVPVTSWGSVTTATNTIKIRCRVGYADDTDGPPLPRPIRAAMLLMLGHLWANREASTEKAMETLPVGVDAMLRPKRIRLGMA